MPNKKDGKSSMDYYKENKASYKKRLEDQKKINATPEARKKRSELVKLNRESQKTGLGKVGDNKDVSHQKDGSTRLEEASKNRGNTSRTTGDRKARGGKK